MIADADTEREQAAPHIVDLDAAEHELDVIHHERSRTRLQERLQAVGREAPTRSIDRSLGIEL